MFGYNFSYSYYYNSYNNCYHYDYSYYNYYTSTLTVLFPILLDGVMSVCDKGFELGSRPKVARLGPVDDGVVFAAAMGGQLFEGKA